MVNSPELRPAIDDLYRVFEKHALPGFTEPCLHCHTMEDEAKLHAKPLRAMECDDLRDYVCDALSVWGDEKTFKHFLPRISELFAITPDSELAFIDSPIIFSKFRHASWRAWPEVEQIVVESYLRALWKALLGGEMYREKIQISIDSWVCTIAQCEDDLSAYLSEWIDDGRQSAVELLSELLIGDRDPDAFWDGREDQLRQFNLWRRSDAVLEKLQRAEATCSDDHFRTELRAALSVVLQSRSSPG